MQFVRKLIKSKFMFILFVQAFVLISGAFAAADNQVGMNSWIDLPIVETIEYFTVLCAKALKWSRRYALLFGLVGIIWNALKVMSSRMQIKQMFWDTTFKWLCFTVLIFFWPSITYGFLGIGTEIGEKAGMGKELVEQQLRTLYNEAGAMKKLYEECGGAPNPSIVGKTEQKARAAANLNKSYQDFMKSVKEQCHDVVVFNTSQDQEKANKIIKKIEKAERNASETESTVFTWATIAALNNVLTVKKVDGDDGDDLTDTFIQLKCYLVDEKGKDTAYISPAAMLRLAVVCGMVMWDRWKFEYSVESNEIDDEKGNGVWDSVSVAVMKPLKKMVHAVDAIPEIFELLFCWIVLIAAVVFAMIQYVMTIIEFTIVSSIAAIFLPLMLFDGTKGIPKKFIPVFIGLMVKIIVMLVCMYFAMYLLTEHALNVITDSWGINLMTLAEVFFIAALCYILTQNAPKIAQTILTGQPELSMGEALQGAGTAGATVASMWQTPGAARQAAARVDNKVTDIRGGIAKMNGAADYAKSQGKGFVGQTWARAAVLGEELKERYRARMEAAGQKSGTGFSTLDKAMQMAGLSGSGGGGGAGGGSSSSAYGQIGQWMDKKDDDKIKSMSVVSNANYKTATKYDERTGQQRHMTSREFIDEKAKQGEQFMRDRENQKKVEQGQQTDSASSGGGSPNLDGMGGKRDSD